MADGSVLGILEIHGIGECVPGMTDVPARLEDLDIEAVQKDLLFPQRTIGLYMSGDVDVREHVFRAHNEAASPSAHRRATGSTSSRCRTTGIRRRTRSRARITGQTYPVNGGYSFSM
jgi:hypothetical protein